ncbi:MAG: hypothetical protein RBS80_31910 [Thermoguttaceae bacterium]|jgi:hypothetical protein|nr:hypothetical protein [Thermoguttaceae bacterium]
MRRKVTFRYDDPSDFVDPGSVVGVTLRWTQLEWWPPAYVLHTDTAPVMWVREASVWFGKRTPTQIRCRGFQGILHTEWVGGKPSLLARVFFELLQVVYVPFPYQAYWVLRTASDGQILAASKCNDGNSLRYEHSEVVVAGNVYEIRMKNEPARRGIFYNGTRIVASDTIGPLILSYVNDERPERATIEIARSSPAVDAVLVYLFMEAIDRNNPARYG